VNVDQVFLVLAIVDGVLVALLALAAVQIWSTIRRASASAQPAVREAKAVAALGRGFVTHTAAEGTATLNRVKSVSAKVKQRVETTRRIVGEVVPHSRETRELARAAGQDAARKTRGFGDLARRLKRIGSAAKAASDAAKRSG
jgi:hypothetical protein